MSVPNTPFELPVVGVTFCKAYPNIAWTLRELGLPKDARLKREPKNEYDSNAIAVYVGKTKLGHIAKNMAKRIAPEMDAGKRFEAEVSEIKVSPDNPNQPGIWIKLYPQRWLQDMNDAAEEATWD